MIYSFRDARLDLSSRQLIRGGTDRPLTPKAFDLLRLLIEYRPRVLTKAEILDLVWPDTFVAEANIAILIGDIRAAIGDTAEDRIIKTHHSVGYSFVAEVVEQVTREPVPVGGAQFIIAIGERRILLPRGAIVVGRDMACDVIIADPSVSRRHAQFDVTGSSLHLEDLVSKNGTQVNGRKLTEKTVVADGAQVAFGAVDATVHQVVGDGRSTQTMR